MLNLTPSTLKLTYPAEHILQVTLDRPEVRNAINIDMMQDLLKLWQTLMQDYHSLRCIILTGSGNRAFCAGADLKARKDMDLTVWREQYAVLQQMMLSMVACPIPIIAAVNGAAFGGGLELALAADFAYAVENATFSQSEVRIGLMPGALGTQHLPRAVGIRKAKELTFTGCIFSAEEALSWGIIQKICSPETLLETTLGVATTIAENSPRAIRQAKKALNVSQHSSISAGYAVEVECYTSLLATEDRAEGILAFNEKRKPVFKDK